MTLIDQDCSAVKDLFKKMRDTKGPFHAQMGLIKDRNGVDLTEAEDIKKIFFFFKFLITSIKWGEHLIQFYIPPKRNKHCTL